MKHLLTIILFLFFNYSSYSAHIIGGHMAYSVISDNPDEAIVEIMFTVYRDPFAGGAAFDQTINVGHYSAIDGNGNYTVISSSQVSLSNVELLDIVDLTGCPFEYEVGKYKGTFTLEKNGVNHYSFTYSRCCRANTLSNIIDPAETGFALKLDIYPAGLQLIGDYPTPSDEFPGFIEANNELSFDMNIDENQSIKYKLVPGYVAGGIDGVNEGNPNSCTGIVPDPLLCLPPFDNVLFLNPAHHYNEGNSISIDETSGLLNIEATSLGNVALAIEYQQFNDAEELMSKSQQQFSCMIANCIVDIDDDPKQSISFYPNPAQTKVYFSDIIQHGSLISANGEEVKRIHNNNEVDISSLNAGIYIIKIENESGKSIYRKLSIVD